MGGVSFCAKTRKERRREREREEPPRHQGHQERNGFGEPALVQNCTSPAFPSCPWCLGGSSFSFRRISRFRSFRVFAQRHVSPFRRSARTSGGWGRRGRRRWERRRDRRR